MGTFNSNSLNHYSNFVKQQNYQKNYNTTSKQKKADAEAVNQLDMDGDNKITSKDKTIMNNIDNELLKDDKKTFDFNNDGEIDYKDLFFISKGIDFDNNGTIDDNEKAYLDKYKSTIVKQIGNKLSKDTTLTLDDLLAFEDEIAKMTPEEQKTWKSDLKTLENKLITSLKKNLDLDTDGNVTMSDLTALWGNVKDLEDKTLFNGTKLSDVLKELQSNITSKINSNKTTSYDFNNDGSVTVDDLINADLNNDGVVTDLEKLFVSNNKSKIATEIRKSLDKNTSLTLQDLLNFENKVATLSADDQKSLKTYLSSIESTMITNIKKNLDIDADGNVTMSDLTALWGNVKDLEDTKLFNGTKLSDVLKDLQSNITSKINSNKTASYDFNNDGNVTLDDLLTQDLNNDGVVTDLEKLFISKNQSKIADKIKDGLSNNTSVTLQDLLDFENKISTLSEDDKKSLKSNLSYIESKLITSIKANADMNGDTAVTTDDLKALWKMAYSLEDKTLINGSKLLKTITSIETSMTNAVLKADKTLKSSNITSLKTEALAELTKNGGVYDAELPPTTPVEETPVQEETPVVDKPATPVEETPVLGGPEPAETTPSVVSDDGKDPNAVVKGTEYNLADLKEIVVNGKTIKIDGTYWGSKGKVVVEDNGRINLYIEEASGITFDTDEDLNIVLRKCEYHYFSLGCGRGNDNIVISEGADFYSVDGKAGDDTIINYAHTSDQWAYGGTLNGGKGNDTIKNYGTVMSLKGDDGDDTLLNDGKVVGYFSGGNGNDTMINDIHGVTETQFQGGDGNDTMINKGTAAYIHGDAGDDTIQNFGTSGTIQGEDGNDTMINEASGIVANLWGGKGDDTMTNHGVIKSFMTGGDGNDVMVNDGVVGSSIYGDDGDDIIDNTNGIVKDYIDGDAGKDTLIGEGNHGGEISKTDFENINSKLKANIDRNDVNIDDFKKVANKIRENTLNGSNNVTRSDSVNNQNELTTDAVGDLKQIEGKSMFEKFFENTWKEFQKVFSGVSDIFSNIWDWIEDFFKSLFGW